MIYESYEGAPGGNRVGFSMHADDDADGWVDEDPLNGVDDDGDGVIDEDFAAISDQMFACEYRDDFVVPPEHRPLLLRVSQESYAYGDGAVNEFIGVRFHVVNDGFELLRHVYLGLYVDPNIDPHGQENAGDDDRGFFYDRDTTIVDTTLPDCREARVHVTMPYMYDVPDSAGADTPASFGVLLLNHTTDPFGIEAPTRVRVHTMHFMSASGVYPAGDPTDDFERYDLLGKGSWISRPTGQPDDYRFLMSVGPFHELAPGKALDFEVAFVAGDISHPSSEHSLFSNAARAALAYRGRWFNADGIDSTGIDGKEHCLAMGLPETAFWRDPCDSLNPRIIEVPPSATCAQPEWWVDDDCDPCTPFVSDLCPGGCETHVHWYAIPAVVPIGLTNLTASEADGGIRLTWEMQNGGRADGFLVLRAAGDSPTGDGFVVLNPGRPVPGGGPYEYVDVKVVPGEIYTYKIEALGPGGPVQITGPVSAHAPGARRFAFLPPAPKPAAGGLVLRFDLPLAGRVRLEVCDLQGRRIRNLIDADRPAGQNRAEWDGRDGAGRRMASGLYLARLSTAGHSATTRMVLIR